MDRAGRRYRAKQHAGTTELVPGTVINVVPDTITPASSVEQQIVKPTATIGAIEVWIGQAVVKVDSAFDAETLRTQIVAHAWEAQQTRMTQPGQFESFEPNLRTAAKAPTRDDHPRAQAGPTRCHQTRRCVDLS